MRTQNVDIMKGAHAERKVEKEKARAKPRLTAKAAAKSTRQSESERCNTGCTCASGSICVSEAYSGLHTVSSRSEAIERYGAI
jgi:hypothetical protein